MKLVVQIPCYNEEENIAKTIQAIPKQIEGIDEIEIIVISDGCTDLTVKKAKEAEADVVIEVTPNKGLAKTFMRGIEESLTRGADIIVNTDGDNQYEGQDIPKLIRPILSGEADLVIGQREIEKFSFGKQFFQKLGSFVVRKVSGTNVPDAPSGFRAYTRDYAMRLNVYNQFTYTLETIIQAGVNKAKIGIVPIHSHPDTRKSRLFNHMSEYIRKSIINIVKAVLIYQPIKFFAVIGTIWIIIGILCYLLDLPLTYFFGAVCTFIGVQSYHEAYKSVSVQTNRKLLEEIQYQERKAKYALKSKLSENGVGQ